MQCACYIAEGDGPFRLNPCPEHERWAEAIRQAERERCAKIVENLARVIGNPYEDPNPKFNTPLAICELHGSLAGSCAEAIRDPVNHST